MTSDSWLLAIHVLIGISIVLVQLWLYWRARNIAAFSEGKEGLNRYRSWFSADLIGRARRGQSPDWMYYRAEIEGLFDPRDERLRVLAAAALATGLGGTMFALIITFLVHNGSDLAGATGPLIRGLGIALFGSLAGVVNHLSIILHLLPRTENRFNDLAEDVLGALREESLRNSPVEMFTQTFQEELSAFTQTFQEDFSALRRSLSTEFGQRLAESLTDLPRAVKELGGHMDRLAEVVEDQARNSDSAVQEIKGCSEVVANSSANLLPTAEQLAASAEQLVKVPEQLGNALRDWREEWLGRQRQEQQEARDQLLEEVAKVRKAAAKREIELQETVAGIKESFDRFPEELASKVKVMFRDLQQNLAQDLGDHLGDLRSTLKENYELWSKDLRQSWRNNVSAVVREVFEELAAEVENRLVTPLNDVCQRLSHTAGQLPEAAQRFEVAHREWKQVHEDALAGWRAAGKRINGAAERLADGDARLERAVAALRDGAGHLERVANATKGFETTLQSVLREATERQHKNLQPLHEEMSQVIQQLRGQYDSALTEQSRFIRNLIDQMLRHRESLREELHA